MKFCLFQSKAPQEIEDDHWSFHFTKVHSGLLNISQATTSWVAKQPLGNKVTTVQYRAYCFIVIKKTN